MKSFIGFIIGGFCGFAIGAWTPLGEYWPLSKVEEIVAEVTADGEEPESEPPSIYEQLRQGAETAQISSNEEIGNSIFSQISQNNAENNWSMALKDVSKKINPVSTAALETEQSAGGTSGDADQAPAAAMDAEMAAYVKFFQDSIEGAEADKEKIANTLERIDKRHPEYFLLQAIHQSDDSFIALYQAMIGFLQGDFSLEKLAALQVTFDENLQAIAGFTADGETARKKHVAFFKILPAKSEEERILKNLTISLYSSYEESFVVEDAFAAKLSDYPSLFALSASGGGAEGALLAWDTDVAKLAERRMAAQAKRREIGSQILLRAPMS